MSWIDATDNPRGIALLGVLVLLLLLSVMGATLLNLAGQETISLNVGREAAVAQQLADAAEELVVGWFHRPRTSPPFITAALAKQHQTVEGWPSFFDHAGRSQFVGTADHPDLLLDTTNPTDDRLLNDPATGLFRSVRNLGTVQQIKIYAPSKPGLLCTIDATVQTEEPASFRQSVSVQLSTLDLPALRAGVQVEQSLGLPHPSHESSVGVHWGTLTVGGHLVVRRVEEIPRLSASAPVTGQRYDEMTVREDRWTAMWVGGDVQVTEPPPGQSAIPILPSHVHPQQHPIPGVRFDRWSYDLLKQVAMRHGAYYVIDRAGLLYPDGVVHPGRGISPDQVFRSKSVGDQLGLIFVDTLDQTAPRADNLGTVRLASGYFEGLAVVEGHVLFSPSASGNQLPVLSPPTGDSGSVTGRIPVDLPGIHLKGVLYAAGTITVDRPTHVYGAVMAEETIVSTAPGASLDVWHNYDMSRGMFEGLPVVYAAPGTWLVRY